LIDLAPTVLHLAGLPIPPDMDGQVLTGIFSEKFMANRPVRMATEPARWETEKPVARYTREEEASVEEQFRKLGDL
jgi:arylsulfatase A-like enzyme